MSESEWNALSYRTGAVLKQQYRKSLDDLGADGGMLTVVVQGARREIQRAALEKLLIVNHLDQANQLLPPVDVKGTT